MTGSAYTEWLDCIGETLSILKKQITGCHPQLACSLDLMPGSPNWAAPHKCMQSLSRSAAAYAVHYARFWAAGQLLPLLVIRSGSGPPGSDQVWVWTTWCWSSLGMDHLVVIKSGSGPLGGDQVWVWTTWWWSSLGLGCCHLVAIKCRST